MERERDTSKELFYSLSDEHKENIVLEPSFLVDGKVFRFDYISKSDYSSFKKLIESINNISSEQNEVIHKLETDINVVDNTTTDIASLKETFLLEMKTLKDTLSNSLKITDKKLITVKDFEEIYSIGEETQRKLRGRFPKDDPLPCIQTAKRGTVLYDPNVIDKWMDNYRNNEG